MGADVACNQNRTFLEVDSVVVSWWIVFFALCDRESIVFTGQSPEYTNHAELSLPGREERHSRIVGRKTSRTRGNIRSMARGSDIVVIPTEGV